MTTYGMISTLISRFRAWWLPFYFGPPCKHGSYGTSYRAGIVLDCIACRVEIDKKIAESIAEEQASESWNNPAVRDLDRRVRLLERWKEISTKEAK